MVKREEDLIAEYRRLRRKVHELTVHLDTVDARLVEIERQLPDGFAFPGDPSLEDGRLSRLKPPSVSTPISATGGGTSASESACAMPRRVQLPSIITQSPGSEIDFREPIGRLQLYTRSTTITRGLVQPGHYGIPEGEEIVDLGGAVDIIPLARRPKAIDMGSLDKLIVVYDSTSAEFKRIVTQSHERDSGCMFGTSFLVFERSTQRFLEFFCGTQAMRGEASKIVPFLPLTAADIERRAAIYGQAVRKLTPHGALPLTLQTCRIPKKRSRWWYLPVVVECTTPFTDLPSLESMTKEIHEFLACEGD